MSVLVKGMKLPRGCRECPFIIWDGSILCCLAKGKQIASNYEPIEYEGRHPDCPLEEADDEEPLVHDGFYLCDKKPGACPSWQKYGWTKCMSLDCNRTSRVDHALKLPDANYGWIPCSERLPEKNGFYLVTLNNSRTVFCLWNEDKKGFGMLGTKWYPCEEVTAWMPLPEPYEQKEKKQ